MVPPDGPSDPHLTQSLPSFAPRSEMHPAIPPFAPPGSAPAPSVHPAVLRVLLRRRSPRGSSHTVRCQLPTSALPVWHPALCPKQGRVLRHSAQLLGQFRTPSSGRPRHPVHPTSARHPARIRLTSHPRLTDRSTFSTQRSSRPPAPAPTPADSSPHSSPVQPALSTAGLCSSSHLSTRGNCWLSVRPPEIRPPAASNRPTSTPRPTFAPSWHHAPSHSPHPRCFT